MNSPQTETNRQYLPNRDNHECFACSPVNEHGLQMTFYAENDTVNSDLIIPAHLCGWNSLAHGGIISTILDEIMSWSAIYLLQKIIMTKSMTVTFKRPIKVGEELYTTGRVIEQTSDREAHMAGQIYNAAGDLCAEAEGRFALFTVEAIRKMNIMDTEDIDTIEAIFAGNQAQA